MMNIQIRPATLDDLEILKVHEQAMINTERPMDITLKRDETIYYYELDELITSDQSLLLVADDNGSVVGAGYAKIKRIERPQQFTFDEYGYLGFMYLLPAYRGKGINQQIIKQLVDWVKSLGLTEIRLKVYDKNPRAIKAYEKSGFVSHILTMRLENDSEE